MTQHPTSVKPAADHGDHPRFLAHHFDTPDQQFVAGKLGMWIFLVTEILYFGALLLVRRLSRHHPEIFEYAHRYLDKTLGAINTLILITSSLTMAWGVALRTARPATPADGLPGADLGRRQRLPGNQVCRVPAEVARRAALGQTFNPKEPPPAAAPASTKAQSGQPRSGARNECRLSRRTDW